MKITLTSIIQYSADCDKKGHDNEFNCFQALKSQGQAKHRG